MVTDRSSELKIKILSDLPENLARITLDISNLSPDSVYLTQSR